MYYYHIFGGLAVTILTILFGVMSLGPCSCAPKTSRRSRAPSSYGKDAARPRTGENESL